MDSLRIALRRALPAVLLLGSISLGLAPAARAQVSFTVTSFTSNQLVFTLNSGALDQDPLPSSVLNTLYLVDQGNDPNPNWILGQVIGSTSASTSFGSRTFNNATAVNDAGNDHVVLEWDSDLTDQVLANPITFTFTGAGQFNPSAVTNFALYWGATSGNALQATGSAVPEPSSFALLGGLGCLGFTLCRRGRHRA